MGTILQGYLCANCGHSFGYHRPLLRSRCPRCGSIFVGEEQRILKPEWKRPRLGSAILGLVMAVGIPILGGLLCLGFALTAEGKAARILSWLGVLIGVFWILQLTVWLR